MGWYGPRGNCGCCRGCTCQINGATESEDVINRIFLPSEEVWTITNIPSSVDYYYSVTASTFAKFTIDGIDAINGTYTFEGGQGPYNLEFPVFGTCGLLLPDGWVTESPEVFSSFSVSNAYWLSIGTLSAFRQPLDSFSPPIATEVDVWLAHARPALAFTPVYADISWHFMYVFMHCADTGESFFALIGSHVNVPTFDREDINSCAISNVRWYRETSFPSVEHYGEGSTVETIM